MDLTEKSSWKYPQEDWASPTLAAPTAGHPGGDNFYTRASSILIRYVPIVWLMLGIVGNFLSLVIMTRPTMRRQSTSLYLSALALADTACLVFISVGLWHSKEPFCHINGWLMSGSVTCSGLLILVVTFERVVVVWFPLKAGVWLRRKWARVWVAAVAILSYGMYIPRLIYASKSDLRYCDPIVKYQNIYYIQLIVFYSVVPVSCLIILNTAVVAKLNMRSTLLQDTTHHHGSKSSEVRKATWMVVTVSMTYICLTLSTMTSVLYTKVTDRPIFSDPDRELLWGVTRYNLIMLNHCVNFWLYVLASSKFRQCLKELLCQWATKDAEMASTGKEVTMTAITTSVCR